MMHTEHDIRLYNIRLSNTFAKSRRIYKIDHSGMTADETAENTRLSMVQEKFIRVLFARLSNNIFNEVVIPVNIFKKAMGITASAKTVKDEVLDLINISFTLQDDDTVYRLLDSVRESNGCFFAKLHESLHPFLSSLYTCFFQYPLGCICGLRTKYSLGLYEYLHSLIGIKSARMDFEELKELLGLPYTCPKDIERRVLVPAVQEISSTTDMAVSYEICSAKSLYYERIVKESVLFRMCEKDETEIEQVLRDAGVHDEEIRAFHGYQTEARRKRGKKKEKEKEKEPAPESPLYVSLAPENPDHVNLDEKQ